MLATTPLRGLADFMSAETALLIAARAVLCCPLTVTAQRNGVVALLQAKEAAVSIFENLRPTAGRETAF